MNPPNIPTPRTDAATRTLKAFEDSKHSFTFADPEKMAELERENVVLRTCVDEAMRDIAMGMPSAAEATLRSALTDSRRRRNERR